MLTTATTWITWDFNQQKMRHIWGKTSNNKQHVADLVILVAVQCVFFGTWFHHLRSSAAEPPSEVPRQVREFCAALVRHRSRGASHGLNTQVGSRLECLQANVQGQADRLIKVNEFLKIIRGAPKAWDSQVTTHLYWIGWFLGVFHGFGNVLLTWLASQRRRRSISKSARSSLCVPVRRASWPPWLVSPIGQPWLT